MITTSLTESQVFTALRAFLVAIMPVGMPIVKGQTNRVAEPTQPDFIVYWPLLRERLEWNTDTFGSDTETITFTALGVTPNVGDVLTNGTATAWGAVLSVSGLAVTLTPGAAPSAYFAIGDAVSDGVTLVGTVTGVTYGGKSILSPFKMTVQLDVHGPNSADNAAIISAVFFDSFATDQFAVSGYAVFPLYASDPKQVPFDNAEAQVEFRWVVDVTSQCNPVMVVPAQYGTQASVGVVSLA
jgi:hypothetical protein